MPSLRIAGLWALMALPKRVLVRQLHANADELEELRDARCVLQREVNSKSEQIDALVSDLASAFARIRDMESELAQAEAELRVTGPVSIYQLGHQESDLYAWMAKEIRLRALAVYGRKGGPRARE